MARTLSAIERINMEPMDTRSGEDITGRGITRVKIMLFVRLKPKNAK